MIAVTRKEVRALVGVAAFAAFLGFFLIAFAFGNPMRSVELGVTEKSPVGMAGGSVVPASCPSYAHSPGECGQYSCGNGCCSSYLNCAGESCYEVTYPIPCPSCPAGTQGTYPDCQPIPSTGGGGGGGDGDGTGGICINFAGTWTAPPDGYVLMPGGTCVPSSCSSDLSTCDFCPNILGQQVTANDIPSGFVVDQHGNCVSTQPETCSIGADNLLIQAGDSTTLHWSCGASSSASGLNFTTGGAPSGSRSVSPTQTTDYWLQCEAGCQDLVTVEVADFTLDISADPTRVRFNNQSTISWNTSGVQNCTVSGPNGFSASGLSGSKLSGPIQSQSTYTLSCQTPLGPRSKSVIVNLVPGTIEI